MNTEELKREIDTAKSQKRLAVWWVYDQLHKARDFAATVHDKIADAMQSDTYGFADHVTPEQKLTALEKERQLAAEIRQGKHDHNFTIAQRMHHFLTGESVPLLPR